MEKAAALNPSSTAGGRHALDLGCGAGRDTRYLLAHGWHVTAVDTNETALALLSELPQEHLEVVKASFEDFGYGHERYGLISAQYALPFIPRSSFAGVFARIKQALKPTGIFTGQFFGVRDEWNMPGNDMTFLTREQVTELLHDLTVIELTEEDQIGATARGPQKHWHVFHVIAKRDA